MESTKKDFNNEPVKWLLSGSVLAGVPLTATGFLWGKNSSSETISQEVENLETAITSQSEVVSTSSFSEAFAAAREAQGPGGLFNWNGGAYNTYYKEEWSMMSSSDKQDYLASVGLDKVMRVGDSDNVVVNSDIVSSSDDVIIDGFDVISHNDDIEFDDDFSDLSEELDSMDAYRGSDETQFAGAKVFNDGSTWGSEVVSGSTGSSTSTNDSTDPFNFDSDNDNDQGDDDFESFGSNETENDEFGFDNDSSNSDVEEFTVDDANGDLAHDPNHDLESFEEDNFNFDSDVSLGGDIIEFD